MKNQAIGLAAAFVLGVLAAPALEAQPAPRVHRLGLLLTGTPPDPNVEAFSEGLRELGYVEGRNIAIDYRWAGGRFELWPDLARALVGAKVDVIVTQSTPAAFAARRATTTIPIVMAFAADPVGTGLVASLPRPGGNVTGLTTLAPTLSAKRLEILKEIFPRASRIAVLRISRPTNTPADELLWKGAEDLFWSETERAGQALGLQLLPVKASRPDQYRDAFVTFGRGKADALVTLGDFVLTASQRSEIVALAFQSKLPAIYQGKESVDLGGLISYGPSLPAMHRRAASFVDKILKGAKPADLPVEQATKFDLVVNLKTARALGLTIPQPVLVRADQVIE